MRIADRPQLRIDSLAFGGEAVGRADDGRAVFIVGGVPGDLVEVAVEEIKPRFARARIVRIVDPSSDRVAPACPLSGRCGSCQWQDVSIDAQRRAKRSIVEHALRDLGAEIAPLIAASPPLGYRTRARLTVGGAAIGFQARRSHEIVDLTTCPQLDPVLDRALAAARREHADRLSEGSTLAGLVGAQGRVHLAIDGHCLGGPTIDTADEGEPPFHAAANGFAQASAVGNRALRATVRRHAIDALDTLDTLDGSPDSLLELYAGDGNFTRDLAPLARSILATEADRDAVERLRGNVPSPKLVAIAEPAERTVERLASDRARFDLVVADPPRTGLRPLIPSLAKLTDRLIYVSCDPITLGRDARELAALGFRPVAVTPLDLMPQTYHVETVCSFARTS